MSDVAKSSSQKSKFGYSEVYSLSTSVSTTTSRTKIQSIISNVKRIVYRVEVSREKNHFLKPSQVLKSQFYEIWLRKEPNDIPGQFNTVLWTIALLYRTTGTTVLCTVYRQCMEKGTTFWSSRTHTVREREWASSRSQIAAAIMIYMNLASINLPSSSSSSSFLFDGFYSPSSLSSFTKVKLLPFPFLQKDPIPIGKDPEEFERREEEVILGWWKRGTFAGILYVRRDREREDGTARRTSRNDWSYPLKTYRAFFPLFGWMWCSGGLVSFPKLISRCPKIVL